MLPLVAAGAAVTAGLHCLGFALSPSVGITKPGTAVAAQRLRSRHVAFARGGAEDDYEWAAAEVIGELKVGQKFSGVVTKVFDFGCFVDFGGDGEGLVPRSKLKDGRVQEKVEDLVAEGDGVTVWISEVNGQKVTLSMTQNKIGGPIQRSGPPDVSAFEGISDSEWLTGKVANIMNFGAFVTVEPPAGGKSADGLVHITQIKDSFVENVRDELSVGQEVKVRVLNVDMEKQKLGLSMKSADSGAKGGRPVTDVSGFVGIPDDEWIPGVVNALENYGAFVTVTPPNGGNSVDGLVHISQIKEGFIEDPGEELETEQEVKVRILEVNTETGRLALTMRPKAVAAEPEASAE